jgi:hypothetical protein
MILGNTPSDRQGAYEFSRGSFKPIESPLALCRLSDVSIESSTYRHVHSVGEGDAIKFWEANDIVSAKYPFYIQIWPFGSFEADVFVPSFPELLGLLLALQPLMLLDSVETATEVLSIARKTFRVQHHHDSGGCCVECDPDEVQRRREFRQQRAKGGAA